MDEHQLLEAVADAAEKAVDAEDQDRKRALAVLRQRLATLRAWQEQSHESDRPKVRTQTCKHCEALFFFACQADRPDDDTYDVIVGRSRWIPLEIDPIDAAGVLVEWRWVVDFSVYPPETHVDLDAASQVYVDHRQTCARNEDGPKRPCAAYLRRWKINSTKIHAETENESIRAANDLLAFRRRLSDKQQHDDS